MRTPVNENSYPLFLPPDELSQKSVKEWTVIEAKSYFNWFVGCMDQRVAYFLKYIDLRGEQSSELLLKQVGDRLENILQASQFYREAEGGCRLSNIGYAIAADAGLLVADRLIKCGGGKIKWEILKRPKSAQSFNLPVLVGFASGVELDPVAASIAQATGVLRGTNKKDRWLSLYKYWVSN